MVPRENSLRGAESRSDENLRVSAPQISLPKGGGAIRGIGEKFAADPVTGTGAMTVPIFVSPGRSGFGPQLSLSYDSGAGNGPFGLGWRLSLPSITRKTEKGLPCYRDAAESDVFILSGAEDLVPELKKDGTGRNEEPRDGYLVQRYQPRIEGLFARIERWRNPSEPSDVFWRAISRDNATTVYGKSDNSRICDPADSSRIFSWLICESYDDKGNEIRYAYKPEDETNVDRACANERNRAIGANRYLKHIYYGNRVSRLASTAPAQPTWLFEVVFDYGEHDDTAPTPGDAGAWHRRPDPFSTYRAGFEVRTYRLCRRALMFHHFPDEDIGSDCLVRSTDFSYRDLADSKISLVASIAQTGYTRETPDAEYLRRSLPPLEFEYSEATIDDRIREVDASSLENLPAGLDGLAYQWVDLDGEGVSGIFTEQAEAWFYKRNLSPVTTVTEEGVSRPAVAFAPMERVALKPDADSSRAGTWQFLDLSGNGQPHFTSFEGPAAGFFERTVEGTWDDFVPFRARPNLPRRDPNLRFIDLTGDGLSDLLLTGDQGFTWHRSLGEAGFASSERAAQYDDEEHGPRLAAADAEQAIYLADFSGDGLTDLVRIRNGEVCYWPNLGYGRFGAKVTMDNAPWFDEPDQFSQQRIRLADIDGSGVTDIIYFGRRGTTVYFNQTGNAWSAGKPIARFPPTDEVTAVQVVDLFGNGTACVLWSSPLPGHVRQPMRYIDLMGGQKPHLLVRTVNNLGAETLVQYAASTKFYLADRAAGTPWITRLPFPVHVVEKVTMNDRWRRTTFTSTYSYHHGYFDGIEREFRGFGRVDQVDVESFGTFAAANESSPYVTSDQTLYQPPVKTITWYHTGAAAGREGTLALFGNEFFPHSLSALPFPTTVDQLFAEKPPSGPDLGSEDLSAAEWRQALRACKGMVLRQETYELDVDELEATGGHIPVRIFSAATYDYAVRRLQPAGSNPFAIFLVTTSETLSYHYELDLRRPSATSPLPHVFEPDPRIAHTLNIRFDTIGNVEQSVVVGYTRVRPHEDDALDSEPLGIIRKVQAERHLTYSETHYTDDAVDTTDPAPIVPFPYYRLRQPWEILTYELTGIAPSRGRYFSLDDLPGYRLSDTLPDQGPTAVDEALYHTLLPASVAPDAVTPQKRKVEHAVTLFFDDDLQGPLAPGELSRLGLVYERYRLALTRPLLQAVLGSRFDAAIEGALDAQATSGYCPGTTVLGAAGADQWWTRSGVAGFTSQAHEQFYLPEAYTDAFDNPTRVEYDDRYRLFVLSTTDPLGNRSAVFAEGAPARPRFDYRVLAPLELQDRNGNRTEAMFDVLGMPVAVAVKGKGTEADTLVGFTDALLNPDPASVLGYFDLPELTPEGARELFSVALGNATTRHLYHFGETVTAGTTAWATRPAGSCTIARERHVATLPSGGPESPLQVAFECSDGRGTVLMKRSQAEPGTGANLRWIVNGKTILNNKGLPVKQYEPYFSVRASCSAEGDVHEEVGVTPLMYYDSIGRLIRTEMPDGSISRVEFSPWEAKTFDANDTVSESAWYDERSPASTASAAEKRAAQLALVHAGTPSTSVYDSLGREVLTIAHNRVEDAAGVIVIGGRSYRDERYLTFSKLNDAGQPLWMRDARGNLVMQYIAPLKPTRAADEPDQNDIEAIPAACAPGYDMAGNLLFQHSMDAGDRWMLNDAAGKPLFRWDFNERQDDTGFVGEARLFSTTYDALRRPIEQWLTVGLAAPMMIERFEYVDAGELGAEFPTLEDAQALNLCGELHRHYDSSGLLQNDRMDFAGNPLDARRQLLADHTASTIDFQTNPEATLDGEVFHHGTEYDALKRITRVFDWHRLAANNKRVAVHTFRYNGRGLLDGQDLIVRATRIATAPGYDAAGSRTAASITSIRYDAKGQRQTIEYGNGTITRFEYDRRTFRLAQHRTTRPNYDPAFPSAIAQFKNADVVQNLYYTYDAVGNVTEVYDDAYEVAFFDNQAIEPQARYTYDALYRLIAASGREHIAADDAPGQFENAPHAVAFPVGATNADRLRTFEQRYRYDAVGNFLEMLHWAGQDRWTRHYAPADDSNRLSTTWLGTDTQHATVYDHDTHGNLRNVANVEQEFYFRWDHRDMLAAVNRGGGGWVYYQYNAGKERIRKVSENQNGAKEWERLYLGGMEIYRRYAGGGLVEEIESHHVLEGGRRVALVEDVLQTNRTGVTLGALSRYQYGNHLGSVCLELDDQSRVITYEEFHPYGTTAYLSVRSQVETPKRYRYTGKERDEETGLSYHQTRYYAPWLGRWCSADPELLVDGPNVFSYVLGNPLRYLDQTGEKAKDTTIDSVDAFKTFLATTGKDHPILKTLTFAGLDPNDKAKSEDLKLYFNESSLYPQLKTPYPGRTEPVRTGRAVTIGTDKYTTTYTTYKVFVRVFQGLTPAEMLNVLTHENVHLGHEIAIKEANEKIAAENKAMNTTMNNLMREGLEHKGITQAQQEKRVSTEMIAKYGADVSQQVNSELLAYSESFAEHYKTNKDVALKLLPGILAPSEKLTYWGGSPEAQKIAIANIVGVASTKAELTDLQKRLAKIFTSKEGLKFMTDVDAAIAAKLAALAKTAPEPPKKKK